jgi:hypothetical protein
MTRPLEGTTAMTSQYDKSPFEQAVGEFDAIGLEDPRQATVGAVTGPYQLMESKVLEEFIRRLVDAPSAALLLACHCQHLARWQFPRSSYPDGREGYLRWRRAASQRSADAAAIIMAEAGIDRAVIDAVVTIVTKRERVNGSDSQWMEDALCLTFLRLDAAAFAVKHDYAMVCRILERTWRKMSEPARLIALAEPFEKGVQQAIRALIA